MALHGPFHQVPELLYFRRDHPGRAERANPTIRSRCANLDPRRANRLRNPTVRLLGEYVYGFADLIRRAPISAADKRECFGHLGAWLTNRARSGHGERVEDRAPTASDVATVNEIVAGREGRPA
jgi:hypothetical protein